MAGGIALVRPPVIMLHSYIVRKQSVISFHLMPTPNKCFTCLFILFCLLHLLVVVRSLFVHLPLCEPPLLFINHHRSSSPICHMFSTTTSSCAIVLANQTRSVIINMSYVYHHHCLHAHDPLFFQHAH